MNNTHTTLKRELIHQFGTPCGVINLDVVERNIAKAQRLCNDAKLHNRPHIKTHKSPILAQFQLDAGAIGITCQKLGEAEVMFSAGINDIVIATNLLGAAACGRLSALQKKVPLKLCADNKVTLQAYANAARDADRPIDVLIECDTGRKRAGVESPHEALSLIHEIQRDQHLSFAGLLYYPPRSGWPATQRFHDQLVAGLNEINVHPGIVSTGGTPNFSHIGELKGATEHRAGTCIFNDLMMIDAGFAHLDDCAFTVYSSVVSRAGENRGILDAGSKTLSADTGGRDGFGLILEYPQARIDKFAEEHGFLDLTTCEQKPEVGEIVRVVPNHVCATVNMLDQLIAIRDDEIVDTIPVAARGRLV